MPEPMNTPTCPLFEVKAKPADFLQWDLQLLADLDDEESFKSTLADLGPQWRPEHVAEVTPDDLKAMAEELACENCHSADAYRGKLRLYRARLKDAHAALLSQCLQHCKTGGTA